VEGGASPVGVSRASRDVDAGCEGRPAGPNRRQGGSGGLSPPVWGSGGYPPG